MALQQICEDVVVDTEGALGCLLLDVNTGLVLALAHRPVNMLNDGDVERVVLAGESLFHGSLMARFAASLGTGGTGPGVREVQITRAYTHEFMTAMPGWDDGILVLVTERTLSIGIGWMVVHQARARLAEARRSDVRELPSAEGAAVRARLGQGDAGDRSREPSQGPVDGHRPASRRIGEESPAVVDSPRTPTPPPSVPATPDRSPPPATDPPPSVPQVPLARALRADHGAQRPSGADTDVDREHEATASRSDVPSESRGEDATGTEAAALAVQTADEPETPKPAVPGPRAKMFRPRGGKS